MKVYQYKARDLHGDLIEGNLSLASETEVVQHLREQGLVPIRIDRQGMNFDFQKWLNSDNFQPKPKREDLSVFCRQMYTLYKAGISLAQAMSRVAKTTPQKTLSKTLQRVSDDLAEGISLAVSMDKFPRIFPKLVINLLRVGEESGRLEEAFLRLSEYLDNEDNTIKQLKAVLRYPMIVMTAMVVAFVVMMMFIVPAFEQFFANFGGELPWVTQALLAVSAFMRMNWLILILLVLSVIGAFKCWTSTDRGRMLWHEWQLKIPAVGPLLRKLLMARFARSYAMVAKTGLSLHRGLGLVSGVLNNAYYAHWLIQMQEDIAAGEPLITAATNTKIFPDIVLQMIEVGEASGHLDDLLEQIADYYEREVAYGLKKLKDALEPILMIMMGGMAMILALGIFLPMWGMSSVIRK